MKRTTYYSPETKEAEAHLFDIPCLKQVSGLEDLFRWHAVLLAGLLEGRNVLHQLEVTTLCCYALHASRLNHVDQSAKKQYVVLNRFLSLIIVYVDQEYDKLIKLYHAIVRKHQL